MNYTMMKKGKRCIFSMAAETNLQWPKPVFSGRARAEYNCNGIFTPGEVKSCKVMAGRIGI